MRDAVVAMLGVPPQVTFQPVLHVDQLLGDDDFDRPRAGPVDSRQVNEHQMLALTRRVRVCSADRTGNTAPEPTFECPAVRGDAEITGRQLKERNVLGDQLLGFRIVYV